MAYLITVQKELKGKGKKQRESLPPFATKMSKWDLADLNEFIFALVGPLAQFDDKTHAIYITIGEAKDAIE